MATDGERCRHEMLPRTCAECDRQQRSVRARRAGADEVYVTARGDRYHDTRECGALEGGQHGAHAQAMNVNAIETVALDEAQRRGKTRCRSCAGQS